jgi:glycyl-tRNA synthetase
VGGKKGDTSGPAFADAQIDDYNGKELGELIRKYNIRNPTTGNELTEPVEFNLMFESNIGPTGQIKG